MFGGMQQLQRCTAANALLRCTKSIIFGASLFAATANPNERNTPMFLSNLMRVLRMWRRYNASMRELSRLGDRELADIGIARSDIPRVAWETAEHAAG